MASLKEEFDKRNCKIIGLSVDPLDAHHRWSRDIAETQGHAPNYPMIADPDRRVADLYGMIHPGANDTTTRICEACRSREPAHPAPWERRRSVAEAARRP